MGPSLSDRDAPVVSVVMCVYNGSDFVDEAIESILAQSYEQFEFVIVDDGSTDSTLKILEDYSRRDSRIRLIRNPTNMGLTRALNRALAASRGTYLARQDADDVSLPDRLSKQVRYLKRHPKVGVLGCRALVIDAEGHEIDRLDFPTRHHEIIRSLSTKNVLCHGSVMMRRKVVDKVGPYRDFFETSQDRDLWLRAGEQFQLANLDDYLFKYRTHDHAVTNFDGDRRKTFKQIIVTLNEQRIRLGRDDFGLARSGRWEGVTDRQSRFRQASYAKYVSAMTRLSNEDTPKAALDFLTSLILHPGNPLIRRSVRTLIRRTCRRRQSN